MVKKNSVNGGSKVSNAVVVRLVSILLIVAVLLMPVVAHYNDQLNFGTGLLLDLVILCLAVIDVVGLVWHLVNVTRKRSKLDRAALLLVCTAMILYLAIIMVANL